MNVAVGTLNRGAVFTWQGDFYVWLARDDDPESDHYEWITARLAWSGQRGCFPPSALVKFIGYPATTERAAWLADDGTDQ